MSIIKKGKKIAILGAGHVGATIAYTLAIKGVGSEIVLVDINADKAKGEAMDIIQGTAFSTPVSLYAGDYESMARADVVIVTVGIGRKPGQSRMDLVNTNVEIIKQVIPSAVKYAPNAIYIVVSNPVDILTYVIAKISGLPVTSVIGSGTLLDSGRLRSALALRVGLNIKNVHAYVFGEHGETSVMPWSLASIAGVNMEEYFAVNGMDSLNAEERAMIESDVRTAGAKVIACKGSTYYAVALSVLRIVESILRDTDSVLTVGNILNGQYGIRDICLSLPFVVGAQGIHRCITPPLTVEEEENLHRSAEALCKVRDSISL